MGSYPEFMVAPMRKELTDKGFQELKSAEEVDAVLGKNEGTVLIMVNSVCGCAAANARPGAIMASEHGITPDKMVTVFAGMETEAVAKVREYFMPYPASSPAIALLKDGEVVHMLERHQIEGRPAAMIAENLKDAFEQYCKN